MTIYTGTPARRGKLDGPERGLDALIGLVILVTELMIGFLAVSALYAAGSSAAGQPGADGDGISFGFAIAAFGGGVVVLITTIVYLGRVVAGRRSWPAPLWGTILMTVLLFVGYWIMAASA